MGGRKGEKRGYLEGPLEHAKGGNACNLVGKVGRLKSSLSCTGKTEGGGIRGWEQLEKLCAA